MAKELEYIIKNEKARDILEKIDELEKLLTERISDMHEVPGMSQARHAYIYYRELLWEIKGLFIENIKEVKTK